MGDCDHLLVPNAIFYICSQCHWALFWCSQKAPQSPEISVWWSLLRQGLTHQLHQPQLLHGCGPAAAWAGIPPDSWGGGLQLCTCCTSVPHPKTLWPCLLSWFHPKGESANYIYHALFMYHISSDCVQSFIYSYSVFKLVALHCLSIGWIPSVTLPPHGAS